MNTEVGGPRSIIREALAERCRRNPRYSMRAFARASGVSHTVLSLVLSGKRPLSKKAAAKMATFLELAPDRRAALTSRGPIEACADDRQSITLDTFELIAGWEHYAILSALELPDARFEPRWLARRLDIGELESKLAMERLQRTGLVERTADGRWRQSGRPLAAPPIQSTVATRTFHRRLLEKAVETLESQPVEFRDFSSITFAMDPAQVGYATARIRAFRRELARDLERRGAPGAVYNLTVQIFPVTDPKLKPTNKKETDHDENQSRNVRRPRPAVLDRRERPRQRR